MVRRTDGELNCPGVDAYSRDPGFDQNTVRDSGKVKAIWDLTAACEAEYTKIWARDARFGKEKDIRDSNDR